MVFWLTIILLIIPGGCITGFAETVGTEERGTEEKDEEETKETGDVCQEDIDAYVQTVSELPAYLRADNAEAVSALLSKAHELYSGLNETEKAEPEVVAAHGAWENMVRQSQSTALISEKVTVNYVSPDQLGEIENLVPRQGTAGPESEGFALDSENTVVSNGVIKADVLHDQGTGGNQEMIAVSCDGQALESDVKLTVKYSNIGTYYEGRIYTDQNVAGIQVNAVVTISNPYNANRISLYENFWMGGTVNGGSGKLGYAQGTPGRADVSITFCDENWNPIALKEDAQLIASSISHGYYKGCSYEGISFSGAEAETTVRIYDQAHGNIGIDDGSLFGLDQTFYGELAGAYYCADSGGPHSGGNDYEDTRSGGTFMVHGVGFYQKSSTWKMTMTTQTTYNGGHDYWFYFTAAPANLTRPQAPTKSVSSGKVQTGETLSYALEQKLSEIQKDGYGYYGSLVFYDTLPEGVEYLSAGMYLDETDVTSSAGTLNYNAAIGKVTYTFSASYLKNMTYNGQTAKLVINCRLDSDLSGEHLITNTGNVSVCGQVESAVAEFTPLYEITTEVVNGTIDPAVTGIIPGAEKTICYGPDSGFVLESIVVDGTEVEGDMYSAGYTFSDILENHHIRVVYQRQQADRSVQLTKRIRASEIIFDHGNPAFLFRLEGTDQLGNKRLCYGAVLFTREYVEANTDADGFVSCTVTFDGLMPGVYTATEEITNRYQTDQIISLSNCSINGEAAVFDLTETGSGSAEFVNRKYEQGGFSHSSLVENKVS